MMFQRPLKAQVSLELVLALICALILFLGVSRLFFWANEKLVLRQEAYENSRASATNTPAASQVNEALLPRLNILGE